MVRIVRSVSNFNILGKLVVMDLLVDYESVPASTKCECTGNWRGEACDVYCPGTGEACSGHGICEIVNNTGSCKCDTSTVTWTGVACNCSDTLTCNSRGTCVSGNCACSGNYGGKIAVDVHQTIMEANIRFIAMETLLRTEIKRLFWTWNLCCPRHRVAI